MMKTKSNSYRSLSTQLVVALFLFSIIVTALFTGMQFALDWHRENDAFTTSAIKTTSVASQALAEHVWSQNAMGLDSQMAALFQHEEIYGIEILDTQGKALAKKVREGSVPNHMVEERHAVEMDSNTPVGQLVLTFTNDRIVDRLFTRLITLILLNTLKASVVSLLVYHFVKRRMAIPLNHLAHYFQTNTKARLDADSDIAFHRVAPYQDEISELTGYVREREFQLANFVRDQENQIFTQARKISESEEIIMQEKARAELSARLAQLGEMATGIAHEINNPLTIISGNIFRLRPKKDGSMPSESTINEVFSAIQRMVDRIAAIIRGLKSYARDGSSDPFMAANPGIILRDMTTLVVGRMISKNVELIVKDETNESTTLECREVQISQVLVILANNALDAIKNLPNPWIQLRVTEEENHITFRLVDCGKGIPAEVQERLFKGHFTTKPVGEGTGLGLSIAIGIVKAHHGELKIDNSSPNTCFVVRLPKAQPTEKTQAA